MSKKLEKLEIYIDNFAYSLDEKEGVQLFQRKSDAFGNMFYVRIANFIAPSDSRTYSSNQEQYDCMKTIISRYADLEYHSKMEKAFKD